MTGDEFERWYAAVATDERDHTEYHSPDRWYDIATGAENRTEADERALRVWCRELYHRDGPATTVELERAFGERQRAFVVQAIEACEHDFGVPFPFAFRIEVDRHWSNGISLQCIEPNGGAGGGQPIARLRRRGGLRRGRRRGAGVHDGDAVARVAGVPISRRRRARDPRVTVSRCGGATSVVTSSRQLGH